MSKHFIIVALVIGMVTGCAIGCITQYYWEYFRYDVYEEFAPSTRTKNETVQKKDSTIADYLSQDIRILCWVMTRANNHKKKAIHVKNTWGKRCNILLFMSTKEDKQLPAIALPVGDGRDNLWAKTKEAFKYVYYHHLYEADWFLKADDDTYVILENLRFMLMVHSPSDPIYFGSRFKTFVKQGYMSGGAGYVLSREAVKRFVEIAEPNGTLCYPLPYGSEDAEMGKCMEAVHITAGDSHDYLGRSRFFPMIPMHHILRGDTKNFWYWEVQHHHESKEGMDGMSDYAISFHYISPKDMYELEYLIYHLKPYGISHKMNMPAGVVNYHHKT